MPEVVVLDYGMGNVGSAVRALAAAGAQVQLTADPARVAAADGLVIPGVGAFGAVMEALAGVDGPRLIRRRLEAGLPCLGICVGMQIMFASGDEGGVPTVGLGLWPGTVTALAAPVVPHMGWARVRVAGATQMFAGIADQHFYFVHSYAATGPIAAPHALATHGDDFIAAVADGPCWATQFHPEKSGLAGQRLLANWIATLPGSAGRGRSTK